MKHKGETTRVLKRFDPWRSSLCTCPLKYTLHPYTGCSHYCLYCYASSYIGRKMSTPKRDFINHLIKDLSKIEPKHIIELSTSSDPYPPIEEWIQLTRKTLEILSQRELKILITTKSTLVTRDIDLLIKSRIAVMITITTLENTLSKKLEPGAPSPSERLKAVRILSENEIPVGVRIDPIIPGINEDPFYIKELVDAVVDAGAIHIVTSTFKARMDSLKRLTEVFGDNHLVELYKSRGEWIHGSLYLPVEERKRLLKPVVERAKNHGVSVATCREGLGKEFFRAKSCDGSHMIGLKPRVRK
ncbi:MAG: radical SAM protein [Thermosphaera sp.]